MYLSFEEFHFSTVAPSFEAIYRAICEIEGTDVPAIMKRSGPRPAPPSPNPAPNAGSVCFADDSLELYGAEHGSLDIHVSEDRHDVYLSGGGNGLFKSSCLALERLGGTIVEHDATHVRKRTPRDWPWFLLMSFWSLLATLCIGLPLAIIVCFGVIPIAFAIHLRNRWRENWREMRLRRRLASTVRYLPASILDAKLKAGEGTLVIEHRVWTRFNRDWWTEEDLFGNSPLPLPTSPVSLPEGRELALFRAYLTWCLSKYTDPATGIARLTDPIPELAASHRELCEKYPRAKIAVIFSFDWNAENSVIFRGGVETTGEDRQAEDGA